MTNTQTKIKSTKDIENQYIKVLVHGPSGSGKTRLCGTTGGKALIASAEAGLLSLRDKDVDFWEVSNINDLRDVYMFCLQDTKYDWICIDSISEIAEVVLSDEKKKSKDARKAYMEMGDIMHEMIRCFRDLPKNIYISSKQDKIKDDVSGQVFFGPSTPGQKTAASLPYFFDLVCAIHTWKHEDGTMKCVLQTQRDNQYEGKDRSGCLDFTEEPNLSAIYAKIMKKELN